MAEGSLRLGGLSSGLAVILNGEDQKDNSSKTHLISYCDDFGNQSVERTLEYIFDLPNRSIDLLTLPIDRNLIRSIINNEFCGCHMNSNPTVTDRDGICIIGGVCGQHVALDEFNICGDIKICKPPLLVESIAMFSSARANACVWKGRWMYEVLLDTSGIQQLGWATLSCPFTDHNGVGDADDSYAFDGKRVSKWNKKSESYGQSWVAGDIIGCCIDLDKNEISFYRNGCSLGVAFSGIRKMGPGFGYHPAISLSQGERCELNFGSRPFKYPIEGYLPLQASPSINLFASRLLQCLSRLLGLQSAEKADYCLVDKLRRLRRFVPLDELFHPVSHGICDELFSALEADIGNIEYVAWGSFMSFMLEVFSVHVPHDYSSLDRIVDVFLEYQGSRLVFEYIIDALSSACKTASYVLAECPYSGSYPYLTLACHLLRREELMVLWWRSSDFQFLFEGFLSRKSPNREDLQCIMPSIWWPGSCEDVSYESSMVLTTSALSESISKIEEKHRDLCHLVIQFTPPLSSPQLPGSVFRTFLQNLLLKNRGADRNVPPPGISSNSVLVSIYTVILHFLSEGFAMGDTCGWLKSCETDGTDIGFLHRGGQQSFPLGLLLKNDPHRTDIARLGGSFSHLSKSHPVNDQETVVIRWEEGCMDDEETKVTHSTRQKPCCCSNYDIDFLRISRNPIRYTAKGTRGHCGPISERSSHVSRECNTESLSDEITDKPSSSDQPQSEFDYLHLQQLSIIPRESNMYSATLLGEEELLDTMLLLYHIGLAPNFKQASYYMSHQSQSIALLEETDKQIREGASGEQLKHLKEARNGYREEVIDCVRHGAWYRISLFSRWKQRGMYAMCMWIVQFFLVVSKMDSVFLYVPEFYLEALVDCFHVLRKSDPPYVPSTIFVKQGLSSFVTFVVAHFNDQRISSADLRDLLLQSISVLVQYKEYLVVFESNEVATQRMPKALLLAFDNRSWIPVTNILLRLCKNSGFGSSKHGESSSSSSVFQKLLREACINDEELFSAFLNRLFNTLSWTMTEFSVSIREMQEKYQLEFQQRKCSVIFDLSCNLARVLEFCTSEIPQAFLSRNNTNMRRLTELIVFILNHITSVVEPDFFDVSLRRHGQYLDKLNRGMILAPLVGMIFNMLDASEETKCKEQDDIVDVFASMDCPSTVHCGFQYLLNYNWAGSLRGEARLEKLEDFLSLLICRMDSEGERTDCSGEKGEENTCCICYACEADAQFKPCSHRSCYGCITRHLLNCQRCFFCNATVSEVFRV